ncbi:hypothetical protein E8E12_006851 [Didymella heteroderae]|uniref:C2H2-type domain-containing protein n=1 Tax=Didymella heteroderae TaxID=1769908 RepID=A0A9P5C681_9PLEO|nr:hypothetical protein E8E12_006851 [Didymella heteroderae]
MPSQQFEDIPRIQYVDEMHYPSWSSDYHGYTFMHKQQATSFGIVDDSTYLDHLEDNMISMQPMERFMFDPSPQTHSILHANIPLQGQHQNQFALQWSSSEVYRYASPDRTSVSGTSSYASQNDVSSPHAYHTASYGSPTDLFHSSQPYHAFEHFSDVTYTAGSSINPKEVEYSHQEPEPTIEGTDANIKQEATIGSEEVQSKNESAPDASYREYSDSGIGNSVRDAQSVQPVDFKEESDADSDYKPNQRGSKRRRSAQHPPRTPRRRGGAVRKDSAVGISTQSKPGRKPRFTSKVSVESCQDDRRSFPCPLAAYNCTSTFSSKNEWKRHVSTQHIKLGFWRCDLCAPTTDPNDASVLYYNDFNRKDLFTQHLRRMHAAQGSGARHMKEYPVNEDNISEHQTRCYLQLRHAPQQSICPVVGCDREFFGPTSWEERMEHVGRHMEKDKKNGSGVFDVDNWELDTALEQYLLNEDLIVWEHGTWKIGAGKSRRVDSDSSDDGY